MEVYEEIHILFIDFKEAYNSIYWVRYIKIFRENKNLIKADQDKYYGTIC